MSIEMRAIRGTGDGAIVVIVIPPGALKQSLGQFVHGLPESATSGAIRDLGHRRTRTAPLRFCSACAVDREPSYSRTVGHPPYEFQADFVARIGKEEIAVKVDATRSRISDSDIHDGFLFLF
jgi:hypothetical protein